MTTRHRQRSSRWLRSYTTPRDMIWAGRASLRRRLAAYPDVPVLASGMVGSRHGLRETPYVSCPAELAVLVGKLAAVEAEGRRVWLAPGLSCDDETGQPDVMRGGEVEILGTAEVGARLVVLPGSHSKWAAMEEGRVLRVRTFVTGELLAALRDHTLAGAFARSAKPGPIGAAFALGVTGGGRRRPRRQERRPAWVAVWRAQSSAHGQAPRRGFERLSVGTPHGRGD